MTFRYVELTAANSFFPMFAEGEAYNCTGVEFNPRECRAFIESDHLEIGGEWACGQDLKNVTDDEMPELVEAE